MMGLGENQKLVELRDWLFPMLMNGQVVSTVLNNREREYDVKESEMNVAAEPCVEYAKGE